MKKELPYQIRKMIVTDYKKGVCARECAERINKTTTAQKLNIHLTTQQVAAHHAWITMRGQY